MKKEDTYICDSCSHGMVCKNKENMEKFTNELEEKVRLLEYQEFGVRIQCRNYQYYDKTQPQLKFEKVAYQ